MLIRDSLLTVELTANTATVTLAFTVLLNAEDMEMSGGFWETVGLTHSPSVDLPGGQWRHAQLALGGAVQPTPLADYKELYRRHTFRVPRYPAGPFTAVGLNGYIEIIPQGRYYQGITNGVVLPAWNPPSTLLSVVRNAVGSFREIFRR